MKNREDKDLTNYTLDELDKVWEDVKKEEKKNG